MKRPTLLPDPSLPLTIIYEDPDVVVVDKPASISVHPSWAEPSGTLVNALLAHYPELKGVGEDPIRPGIVHRLDKDTSGVLVVARNQGSFKWLKEQFKAGTVEKEYIALVSGRILAPSGTIALSLGRRGMKQMTQKGRQKKSLRKTRHAITWFRVLKRFSDTTLLLVVPKTGRMHQIRAHFAAVGHPIVGDRLYGPRKKTWPIRRHFLHAAKLTFSMPDARRFSFESELPEDLSTYLATLKQAKEYNEATVTYE